MRHIESTTSGIIEGDELVSLDQVDTQPTIPRRLPFALAVTAAGVLAAALIFVVGRESARGPPPVVVIPSPVKEVPVVEVPLVVDAGVAVAEVDAGAVAVVPVPVDAGVVKTVALRPTVKKPECRTRS